MQKRSQTEKSSWWSRATTKDRLAQIDGGIECGMTSKQIAICLGADTQGFGAVIRTFALRHNRHMATSVQESARRAGRAAANSSRLRAARRAGMPDSEISSAFSIFGSGEPVDPLLDEVPG